MITNLTVLAARLGISSLRPPQMALAAARAHAALHDRDVTDADVQAAAALVLAPRATQLPQPDAPDAPPEAPQETKKKQAENTFPEDILVEAITAILPADLLENPRIRDVSGGKGTGAGQRKKGNRRGRPLPSRPGRLDGSARLDLVATLRTAAPWQKLRKRGDGPVKVIPSDIHVKRYEDKSDRLIIFAVDASGSAALARLAEAKGAVELLLSRAYAKRDHVSLIAFRGEEAELLLPPTRSLVQTKKRLAGLPGGGGTPLAAGLKAAGELAYQARSQGLSPMVALLTDGRANIALDGSANRAQAAEDSTAMARWLRSMGLPVVVLDLGNRPAAALATLAKDMNGTYLPLPRADAATMSGALNTAMQDGLGA